MFKELFLFVEENLNLKIKYRILAGLFALFATSKLEFFTKICCCSASFWYPGFLDYVKNNEFSFKEAYFSIGDKESKTKNQFLSKAYDSMIEIKEIFENKGKTIIFELNEGGHFNNVEKRMIKGIMYLINDI